MREPVRCIGADNCMNHSPDGYYASPGCYVDFDKPYCNNAVSAQVPTSYDTVWYCNHYDGPRRVLAPRELVEASRQPPEPPVIEFEEYKPSPRQEVLKIG